MNLPKFEMSKLFKASLLMAVFFAVNKIVALYRQYLITKQFGLSASIDAFNVSNNVPDLLFSLIAGGALAMAIIPVLTENFDKNGQEKAWRLLSRIINLVFIVTAILAVIVGIIAKPLVSSQLGIAPGFTPAQQDLTVYLMRLNLIATVVFSISGLVMSGLQAKKHFLLPAIAPIMYNIGQIVGVAVIAPFFGIGVYGLAYGVILGAVLHLLVQLPALYRYKFRWDRSLGLNDPEVRKVIRLLGPRILTVLLIQIIFLTRDNLASRLAVGSVSALTYGYYILQVPETLIGTAIGTALLPTLTLYAKEKVKFGEILNKTLRVMLALTLVITAFSLFGLSPLTTALFGFSKESNTLLVWVTNAYMIGLFSQSILEVTTRAFYAKLDAKTPLILTILRTVLYIVLAIALFRPFGATGLALSDTLTVTVEVLFSLYLLNKHIPGILRMRDTLLRCFIACVVSGGLILGANMFLPIPHLISTLGAMIVASGIAFMLLKKEMVLMVRL